MARKFDPKAIKARIKDNTVIMREEKKVVSAVMTAATKGEVIDPAETRKSLAKFIKAAVAIRKDKAKLDKLAANDEPSKKAA